MDVLRLIGNHLGHDLYENDRGRSYRCLAFEIEAPTLTDLKAAVASAHMRQLQGLEPYRSGIGFPTYSHRED